MIFKDRDDAGRKLGKALKKYVNCPNGIVLALPRGGVPVGAEVAKQLRLPLDVFIVRKLGFPGQEELAMGAVDSVGGVFLNEEIAGMVSAGALEYELQHQRAKIAERLKMYHRAPLNLKGKTVILVDDGIATGASMNVAARSIKKAGALKVVIAAPVAPTNFVDSSPLEEREVIVLSTPEPFGGVGRWYETFDQVEDSEVLRLLKQKE